MAAAQVAPSIDARTWRPSADPEANLVFEPTRAPGSWQWNVSAWAYYAQDPVVLRPAATSPLEHLLGVDLVAELGLGERAAVGVDVPAFLWQDGASSLSANVVHGGAVPTTGFGDASLLGKATIASNDQQGVREGFGLAALADVSLPTGNRSSFMSEGSLTVSLVVLAEYAIGVGAVRASLGYRLRTDTRTWPEASMASATFGDEIPWAIGVALRPKAVAPVVDDGDRQIWEFAAHGSLPAGPVAPLGLGASGASSLSPAMLAVDDRIALGHYRDAFVLLGCDLGLDTAVGVPSVRAVVSLGWAPRVHDRDGDGIPDDVDECPDLPEDRDRIQDEDGCPEDDADSDGILDPQDACPLVPGVASDDPKRNGCPAEQPLEPHGEGAK